MRRRAFASGGGGGVWAGPLVVGGGCRGRAVPGLGNALAKVTVTGVSLPIALGLLVMMYPV
ncbi:hypothetical protein AB0D26_30085, partial [Streptomyces libani]